MNTYWFAVRPDDAPHHHPFLVFDRQDRLHFPLTVFAKTATESMAASTVRTYLYAILPFFTFLEKDEWQQRAGVQWHSPPDQVRRAINDYLVQRLSCQVREHRQGFQMVGQTEGMRSSARIFLSALKLFYHTMRQRNSYLFQNPLVDGIATALAEVEREVRREQEVPQMPEKSGVVKPGRSRHLSDSYFKLEHEQWIPQIIDDPLFPVRVFAGGQKCGWRLREECITRLLFETGARVSEVVGLTLGDWAARGTLQEVNAFSKGSRGRRVKFLRFHADTAVLLRRYVDTERRVLDPHGYTLHDYGELSRNKRIDLHTLPLFLSQQRTPLSVKTYREHGWNPACEAVAIDADVHQARHWYVTQAVRLIYGTSQTDGDVQRRLKELMKYMGWKQGWETLEAYEHYLDAARHADIADALHVRMQLALQQRLKPIGKSHTKETQACLEIPTEQDADFAYLLQLGGTN